MMWNKRRKISLFVVSMMSAAMLCSGCGAQQMLENAMPTSVDSFTETYATDGMYQSSKAVAPSANDGTATSSENTALEEATATDRKLIKNASLSVETEDIDAMDQTISSLTEKAGGYVENSSVDGQIVDETATDYRSNQRRAYYSVRIPVEQLDQFISNVGEQSNITNTGYTVQDITLQYSDTDERKKSLEIEENRLNDMMKDAETVEDMIAIEAQLETVRYQLADIASTLKIYDNQIAYSTVSIDVTEVRVYTITPAKDPFERMRTGFMESLDGVIYDLQEAGIWVVSNLPYLVVGIIVFIICILLLRLIIRFLIGGSRERRVKEDKIVRKPAKMDPLAMGVKPTPQTMENKGTTNHGSN